jgi:16S rRNA (cytidine1402-2'-O)-methyltransferase
LPASALEIIRSLEHFVAENAKSARGFLSAVGMPRALQEIQIVEIENASAELLKPLRQGRALGLVSEAGCPAIADPGAALIEVAHREGFRTVPLVGPSSIVLALMASGLEGQRFAFCGYLPREAPERAKRIRQLEERSRKEKETEIFIETPYRNEVLLAALLDACDQGTRLCIAADLTLPGETVTTRAIGEWRRAKAAIGRRPAVFLLQASSRK